MKIATFKKLMAASTQAIKHSMGKLPKLKTTKRRPKKAKR